MEEPRPHPAPTGTSASYTVNDPIVPDNSISKLAIILVILLGVVSVVAIIIASLSLTRQNDQTITVEGNTIGGSSSGTGGGTVYVQSRPSTSKNQGKIWTVAVGHDYGVHEYIDTKGYLSGFHHDLIKAVCNAARINCEIIWDKYVNCWNSTKGQHSKMGFGLSSRWYDACTGWTVTVTRIQSCSFSMPFLKAKKGYFWVKEDDFSFTPTNINGKTIGFLDGWSHDEKCMARQSGIAGSDLPVEKVKLFTAVPDLLKAITDGTVDAGFQSEISMGALKGIKKAGNEGYFCAIQGNSMMMRKDNDFSRYWNEGLQKLMSNGAFQRLCKDANERHNNGTKRGDIECVDS